MSVLGSLTMEDLGRIRKMGTADAELFLSRHPTLTFEERKSALALAGKDIEQPDFNKVRRQWLATAWLLGASYRQLGTLHGIARQTVMDIVCRMLTDDERRKLRIANEMSLESLSHLRFMFNKHVEHLSNMSVIEAAQWLFDNNDYTEEER